MNSQERILSYIYRFACEEKLGDLQELLADKYSTRPSSSPLLRSPLSSLPSSPHVLDNHRLNIPSQGLFKAIDNFETEREQDATKEVRALYQYYTDILDVPVVDNKPFCPLPEEFMKRSYSAQNTDPFPFVTNILSCASHPALPNILITSSASRDLVVSYFPIPNKVNDDHAKKLVTNDDEEFDKSLKPIILARSTDVSGPILSIDTALIKQENGSYNMLIFTGLIDGTLSVFKLSNLAEALFTTSTTPFILDMLSLELTKVESLRVHQKYLTRIKVQQHTFLTLPLSCVFRVITGSHDESIGIVDISVNGEDCTKVECVLQKQIEFKGKVESLVMLPTPTVFSQQTHPILQYPSLLPSKETMALYHTSVVRKLSKGDYLDSVDFISPSIPFSQTPTIIPSTAATPSFQIPELAAVSVRNDAHIHIININTMEKVDTINVNITGDDHVSFTTLDMLYDPHYGLIYLATDNQLVLIIDSLTKQHVRRLYCTENNDLSNPILQFLPIPQIYTTPVVKGDGEVVLDMQTPDEIMKNKTYLAPHVNLLAITTSNNSVKVYNQHTQEQIKEYQTNKKNIKGFVLLPPVVQRSGSPAISLHSHGFITTGFDKSFSVYY